MRARATAVGAERSNAVGTIEIECTPTGLSVVYLGVGSFSAGYAPGALTAGTSVLVPWPAVLAARVEGDQIYLEVDPRITPHNRLVLTSFSTGDLPHPRELVRQRWVIRIGALGVATVAVLVTSLGVPRVAPQASAAVALSLGLATAALVLLVGLAAERWGMRSTVDGREVLAGVAADLERHLPNVLRSPSAPEAPPRPLALPTFQGLLPRTSLAIAITLTACLLGALLAGKNLIRRDDAVVRAPSNEERRTAAPVAEAPPVDTAVAAPPNGAGGAPNNVAAPPPPIASSAPPSPAVSDTMVVGAACSCARAGSALWTTPIPKLAFLVLGKKLSGDGPRKRLTLELAAVNDSDQPLSDIALRIDFWERDPPPSNKRYLVSNRAVFFAGPLEPGSAIKWSVEARGTSVSFESPLPATLGAAGEGAAPTNLLLELLKANHRPVRLHGAMLLAYLGDPRAQEVAFALKEALRDEESAYLRRVLEALAPVRVCDLSVTEQSGQRRVSACVANASGEARENLAVLLRALDRTVDRSEPTGIPPNILAETALRVPGTLAPRAGVRVTGNATLSTEDAPAAYEAIADRADLLR